MLIKVPYLVQEIGGTFEVEFQNPTERLLRVTENKNPAPPPAGFTNLEGLSWKVEIGGGGTEGLTLQKIDYILDAAVSADVDISQGQIGKLCSQGSSFIVGEGIGELEFEAEENELTLTVDSLVGEWAVFVPTADAGAGAGAGGGAGAGEGGEVVEEVGGGAGAGEGADSGAVADAIPGCEAGTACRVLLDAILGVVQGGAAAGGAAGAAARR